MRNTSEALPVIVPNRRLGGIIRWRAGIGVRRADDRDRVQGCEVEACKAQRQRAGKPSLKDDREQHGDGHEGSHERARPRRNGSILADAHVRNDRSAARGTPELAWIDNFPASRAPAARAHLEDRC